MTNRELIVKKLESGKTIWRYTPTSSISYTKVNDGIWRVCHGLASSSSKKLNTQTAISQLVRNFKQIASIH